MICQCISVFQSHGLPSSIACDAFPECYGVSSKHDVSHRSSCCSHDLCQGHATCATLKLGRASRGASSQACISTEHPGRGGWLHGTDPHRSPQSTCTMSRVQPSSCSTPSGLCTCGQHAPVHTKFKLSLYY